MKKYIAAAAALFCIHSATSQSRKNYIVKAGESPMEVLPFEARYTLPSFTQGTVFLKDGSLSQQKLNYNFMLDEMQFIQINGDTLAIADPALIKNVVIDTSTFYFDKFYLKQLLNSNSFKLAEKQMLLQTPDKVHGAYDMATASSAITTYGSVSSNSRLYHLQVKKDVAFAEVFLYYIGDQYNHFVKADKKGFLAVFLKKRNIIQTYLKENNINFSKTEDVEKLFIYCTQ